MEQEITQEQLQKLISSGRVSPVAPTEKEITQEELDRMVRAGTVTPVLPPEDEGMMSKVGSFLVEDVLAPVGTAIDQYGGGASTRAAIGELMTPGKGVGDAASAFMQQYGEDPTLAPTGKQLAQRMGASETSLSQVLPSLYSETGEGLALERGGMFDPTASGAAGLGIELVADPLNLIPGVGIAKGTKASARVGGQVAKEAVKETAKAGVRTAVKSAEIAKDVAVAGLKKAGALTDEALNLAPGESAISKHVNALIESQKGKVAKNLEKDFDTISRLGLDPADAPASVVFEGAIPRTERAIAYGPTGQEFLEKIERFYDALDDKTIERISSVGGVDARTVAPEFVGDFMTNAVENATSNLFKNNEVRYSAFVNNPKKPMFLSQGASNKLTGSMDSLFKRAERMMQVQQPTIQREAKELMNTISGIRDFAKVTKDSKPPLDFFVQNLQNIRALAYPKKNKELIKVTPEMEKVYKEIYKTLNQSIVDSVYAVDKKMGAELVKSNQNITKFSRDIEPLQQIVGKNVTGRSLFDSVKGDAKKIEALKNVLDPKEFEILKTSLIKDTLNMNAENQIMYAASKKGFDSKKALLSKFVDKKTLQDIEDALALGVRGEGRITSLPQTGAALKMDNIPKQVLSSTQDRLILENLKKSAAKGSPILSKLYGTKDIVEDAIKSAKPTKSGLMSIELPKTTLDEILRDFVKEKTSKEFMGVKALSTVKEREEEK